LLLVERQIKLRAQGRFEHARLPDIGHYANDFWRGIRRHAAGVGIAAAELLAEADAVADGVTFRPVEARHRVADHHRARGVASVLSGKHASLEQADAHGAEVAGTDDPKTRVLAATGILRGASLNRELPGREILRAINHGLPGN